MLLHCSYLSSGHSSADSISLWVGWVLPNEQDCVQRAERYVGPLWLAHAGPVFPSIKGLLKDAPFLSRILEAAALRSPYVRAPASGTRDLALHGLRFISSAEPLRYNIGRGRGLFYQKSEEIQKDIDRLVADASSCSKESIIAYTLAMRDRPDRRSMMRSKIPILFIAGEKDTAVPLEMSINQTRSLNSKFIHFLPETGHMGMFERKSETLKIVADFLEPFKYKSEY